jgi:hypothetical protein
MRVVCTASFPNQEQINELGDDFYTNQDFGLIVGREYLVLGLSYTTHSYCGNTVTVSYFDEDHLLLAPIILFEITDHRVSHYWEVRKTENGSLTLWPPLFYESFFRNRLSDYEKEARESFERVYQLLDSEHN